MQSPPPHPSPGDSCTSGGSGALGLWLGNSQTSTDPVPCADSVLHVTVLKYTDAQLVDTCKQRHTPVSCSLGEGSDFSLRASRFCATCSAHPLGYLTSLDPAHTAPFHPLPSSLPFLPPLGLCTGQSLCLENCSSLFLQSSAQQASLDPGTQPASLPSPCWLHFCLHLSMPVSICLRPVFPGDSGAGTVLA